MRIPSRSATATVPNESDITSHTLHEQFASFAKSTPDAIAVTCDSETFTYALLNQRSNQLARRLRSEGIGPGKMVGILMERSARVAVGILGILKAGAAYVPIDPVYPNDRIHFMLQDSGCPVVLTDSTLAERLNGFSGTVMRIDPNLELLDTEPSEDFESTNREDDVAYVIYTSGSTGRPKGVQVTHHNVLRLFTATEHWFNFSKDDVWSLFHSFAFDFSVWELWGALLYGGTVVVVPYLTARDPDAFYRLLGQHGVTVLSQTPSAFRQLIAAEENAERKQSLKLRYVIFGGEALELQSLRPWFQRHSSKAPLLVNMYGITETTVHVTYRPILPGDLESNQGSVIGEPIPDLTIHLLDEQGAPVPDGTPGEIYVGGEGVAKGYLNRVELTSQRFLPDRFDGRPEARLYRSGDLAKRLPNGDLEYLGRIDQQVKIHGFRIELGEIETALNSHPAVRESTVICDESTGDKRLIAYIVPRGSIPSIHDIREFAGRKIPAYMLPSRIVTLDKLPLTVNGKVDKKALPLPDSERPQLRTEFRAPESEDEKILAQIWQEVLAVDRVGVDDNFFELGGDSIRSIQVLARARARGIKLSLQALFKHPSISEALKHQGGSGEDEIKLGVPFALIPEEDRNRLPSDVVDAYPIGALQHGMIYHTDLDLESAIFHDVFSFRLSLPYHRATLAEAVERLSQRHSIFRTSFRLGGFSQPLQLVHRTAPVPITEEDLSALNETAQHNRLVEWVEGEKRNRFDWEKAPLMRLHVQRRSEDTFQFIVSFHHTIMDGWSLAMMLTELFQDYHGLITETKKEIPAPAVTYRDFVILESSTVQSEESRNFWTKLLEEPVTHQLPRWPHAPAQKAREQTRGPEVYFPEPLLRALQDLARSCGVPIRTVLLAAHCRVMKLLAGCDDVLTGLVANGRPQCIDGERLVGLFLNTLPFRVRLENDTWRTLVKKVFASEQSLIPHRRMPLAEIQRLSGGQPLFETVFDFVQFHVYRDLPGYKDHSFLEDHYFEANNFNFFVTFMLDASSTELQMHFDYDPNLFPEHQIRAICEYYREALRAMAAAPDESCVRASLIAETERKLLLREWNHTKRETRKGFIHDWVESAAARKPAATAIVAGERATTYEQLRVRSNAIASALQKRGIARGSLVGIYMERCADMIAAMWGVHKAGAAYLPLDPAFPKDRLAFMIKDSGLECVLATPAMQESAGLLGCKDLCVTSDIASPAETFKPVEISAGDRAYVIYTSGSTGVPKGVEIPHGALSNFLDSMRREPGITSSDRLLAVTTLSFDIAGLEIWLPLAEGATVVLANSDEAKDPIELMRLLEHERITMMQATPITWRALITAGWTGKTDLKALCGGEAISPTLARDLRSRTQSLWNMYGPTETTIWSSVAEVSGQESLISIGRPIDNTEIYVLDADLNPVPVGSTGEIHIGGDGLATGYLNRPELTVERFIASPFSSNRRLYRTGDLGCYLPDGRLVCLGRTDNQVKVRGFRIELGEIETLLEKHPAISKAVVKAEEDQSGTPILSAFWVNKKGLAANATELRALVGERLPAYMIPTRWMALECLPTTANGKVDRRKLPAAFEAPSTNQVESESPMKPLEAQIAEIWRTILGAAKVGVDDDFFELGGHSLAAMRVVGTIRSNYKVEMPVASFLRAPTIKAVAAKIEELSGLQTSANN